MRWPSTITLFRPAVTPPGRADIAGTISSHRTRPGCRQRDAAVEARWRSAGKAYRAVLGPPTWLPRPTWRDLRRISFGSSWPGRQLPRGLLKFRPLAATLSACCGPMAKATRADMRSRSGSGRSRPGCLGRTRRLAGQRQFASVWQRSSGTVPAARARTVLRWINRLVPVSGTFLHLIDRIGHQAVGLAVDLVGGPGIRCLD
jgi:hypothetical protein